MKKLSYNNYNIISDEDIFPVIKKILVKKIKSHLSVKPYFSLALSGGSTPVKLYKLLAEEKLPWEKVKVFLVDERVLPPGDSGLNWKMIEDEFLSKLSLPPLVFPPEDLYNNTIKACEKMEKTLKKELPCTEEGVPLIDLILLGAGKDGHTASLFYGKEGFYEKRKFIALTEGPPPFQKRITFTFPLIKGAGQRWFLVAGKDKRDILRNIFKNSNENLPAGIAAQTYPAIWFLDSLSLPELDYNDRDFNI